MKRVFLLQMCNATISALFISILIFSIIGSTVTAGFERESYNVLLEANNEILREKKVLENYLAGNDPKTKILSDFESDFRDQLSLSLDNTDFRTQQLALENKSVSSIQEWVDNLLKLHSYSPNEMIIKDSFKVLERTDRSLTTELKLTDEISLVETAKYLGEPDIKLIEPELHNIDNIIVPIVKQSSSSTTVTTNNRTVEHLEKFGFEVKIKWKKTYSYNLKLIKLSFSAIFAVQFRMMFPMNIKTVYPEEVIAGQEYTLETTLIPLDLANYDEFLFKTNIDAGITLKAKVPTIKWVKKTKKIWGIKIKYRIPKVYFVWKTALAKSFGTNSEFTGNYMTPLGDVPALIKLDDIPLLNRNFNLPFKLGRVGCEIGLGGEYGGISTEKITGLLKVETSDFKAQKQAAWGENHDPLDQKIVDGLFTHFISAKYYYNMKHKEIMDITDNLPDIRPESDSLTFKIPESSTSEFVKFSVSDLKYFLRRLSFSPKFYIDFNGILSKLGKRYLPIIGLGSAIRLAFLVTTTGTSALSGSWFIPIKYYYSTSTSVDNAAFYNFDFTISPQNSPSKFHQHYKIDLTSLGTKTDTIELQVSDLPVGYTATFDRKPAVYDIKPRKTTIAYLTINKPQVTVLSPGNYDFTLEATSRAKKLLSASDASISKISQYSVPEIHSLDFSIAEELTEITVLEHGQTKVFSYNGGNLGNVNERVTVNATLFDGTNITHQWTNTIDVSPYGSATSQYFSGNVQITFDSSKVFLPPGYYRLEFNASSLNDPIVEYSESCLIEFTATYGVDTTLTPSDIDVFKNQIQVFNFTITNTGNVVDNYTIHSDGWDLYLDYETRVLNLPAGESVTVSVTLNIPDGAEVTEGTKTFHLVAVSEASGELIVSTSSTANVNILPADYSPPTFERVYDNITLTYPFATPLDLGPTWIPHDDNPGTYVIYKDGVPISSGGWSNGQQYHVQTNTFSMGIYNITALFSDVLGNTNIDTVWVEITTSDSSYPSITSLSPISLPRNFQSDIEITWFIHEENILNATLYKNGTKVDSEFSLWQDLDGTSEDEWNATLIIKPGSLDIGIYEFSLLIQDMSGLENTSKILISITPDDTLAPVITTPPTSSINQNHGENITFTANDLFPAYYELWINGTQWLDDDYVDRWTWETDTVTYIAVDELPLILGENDLQLRLYDITGNITIYNWTLILNDIDTPVLKMYPTSLFYYEYNISEYPDPYWVIEDLNPGSFSIYLNDTLIDTGNWSLSDGTIYVDVGQLTKGVHKITGVFNDSSGNELNNTFTVTVNDITSPAFIKMEDIDFEPYHVANWFEFNIIEKHPKNYILYRNGTIIKQGEIPDYHMIVLVELNDLDIGTYNYTLIVTDKSGNMGSTSVMVIVKDYSRPIIEGPPFLIVSESSPNKIITWKISEEHPVEFTLYRDGVLIDSGSLKAINGISYYNHTLEKLSMGQYEYVLNVKDAVGLSHSHTTYVQVIDATAPWLSKIGNFIAYEGDVNASIEWEARDNNPSKYIIYLDGVVFLQKDWDGTNIVLSVSGWAVGEYRVKLVIQDKMGNTNQDEVTVEILESKDVSKTTGTTGEIILLIVGFITVCSIKRKKNRRK
ncbi:MAG: COG1470 family protein [Candidatus Hodarchaeales archaeon]